MRWDHKRGEDKVMRSWFSLTIVHHHCISAEYSHLPTALSFPPSPPSFSAMIFTFLYPLLFPYSNQTISRTESEAQPTRWMECRKLEMEYAFPSFCGPQFPNSPGKPFSISSTDPGRGSWEEGEEPRQKQLRRRHPLADGKLTSSNLSFYN